METIIRQVSPGVVRYGVGNFALGNFGFRATEAAAREAAHEDRRTLELVALVRRAEFERDE